MCQGDDSNCPEFEAHRAAFKNDFRAERRAFLRSRFVATGGAAATLAGGASLVTPALAQSSTARQPDEPSYHYLPVNGDNVHWGYFSRSLKPRLEINPSDYVTIETLTHQASDDMERMVNGDPGAESVYAWTREHKAVNRRGAGPMDAAVGAGAGAGVHICTGPVAIRGAMPGDVLEVRILDTKLRPCANPAYKGRAFGTNLAAWWGFQYKDLLTDPKPREVVTIYELDASTDRSWAQAVYNFTYTPQTDPSGVRHAIYDYPGVPIDHATVRENHGVLKNIRVPVRPHFGTMGVAPREMELVNSIPPAYFGGNIDNWRIGKGATMYYPVAVEGGLFSVGDPHASQGDSELCGTAIECSMTGTFQFILHRQADLAGTPLEGLDFPMLETAGEWLMCGFSYPNYLQQLGPNAQTEIASKSSLDLAMRDAFRKVRQFLMKTKGLTEDEAISLITVGVDFGVTQVVDANWGVHAIVRKAMFGA